MWGNKEGWITSAVIVILMAFAFWRFELLTAPAMAAPSGQFKNLREPIALPVKPEDALRGVMTDDRDAGDLYWKAIEAYRADPDRYVKFEVKNIKAAADLEAVNLVVEATSANRATVFAARPETIVKYKPSDELETLFKIGQLANSIGFYHVAISKDEKLAKQYLHAGFSLGTKLYNERLTHGELISGIQLMQGAADALKALAKRKGDAAREAELQKFGDQTSGYYTSKVQKLNEKLSTTGVNDVATHSGDVFELALHNPDRMWRIEALMKLGRYKYEMGGSKGDQLWAERLLKQPDRMGLPDFTKSKDPAVARAATIARDLTVEDFRMIE